MNLLQPNSGTPGPPISPTEQLDRLLLRGIAIHDQDEALRFLNNVSFYRFRGYLEPFVDPAASGDLRPFLSGASFDEAMGRYKFDSLLRASLLEAFNHIEISLRAQWTLHLTYSQKGGEFAHRNENFFGEHHTDNLDRLERDYDELGKERHGYSFQNCPTWAASEVMTLGQLSRWYGDSILPVRKDVANYYRIHHRVMKALVHRLSTVRNFCAHHERLWDEAFFTKFSLPRRMGFFSNPPSFFNTAHRGKLYNTLVMVAYLTRTITGNTDWTRQFISLMDQHPYIPQETMGFVTGWRDLEIWQP